MAVHVICEDMTGADKEILGHHMVSSKHLAKVAEQRPFRQFKPSRMHSHIANVMCLCATYAQPVLESYAHLSKHKVPQAISASPSVRSSCKSCLKHGFIKAKGLQMERLESHHNPNYIMQLQYAQCKEMRVDALQIQLLPPPTLSSACNDMILCIWCILTEWRCPNSVSNCDSGPCSSA